MNTFDPNDLPNVKGYAVVKGLGVVAILSEDVGGITQRLHISGWLNLTKQHAPKRREVTMMYRCSKCHRLYKRDSTKSWIKSYCEKTGQYARLMRIEQ